MKHFKIGSHVVMTNDALENYGEEYDGVVFVVSYVSKSESDHPGYDRGMSPEWLYDLKSEDGEDFGLSLYDYELESA